MKTALIIGGAGFIGSHLVDRLIKKKWQIVVLDNLSTGKKSNIAKHLSNKNFRFIHADIFEKKALENASKNVDIVYHFAANADVKSGISNPNKDFKQGIMATREVLEIIRVQKRIRKIIFPSSMTVYGVNVGKSFSEASGPCLPISFYAAAKLGAEGLISSYVTMLGIKASVYRLANVIGPRLTHGVIYDLIQKLIADKVTLKVLGDGRQTKPYIYISDVVDAIEYVEKVSKEDLSLHNLGVENVISVKKIVELILKKMHLSQTKIAYGKTTGGWVGDVAVCRLNIYKLKRAGFTPKFSSQDAVGKTIDAMLSDMQYGK